MRSITVTKVLVAAAVAAFGALGALVAFGYLDMNSMAFGLPFAVAAVAQASYSERIEQAAEGMLANSSGPPKIDSRIVQPTSGIPFGRACAQGTAAKGVGLGGALTSFVGVSLRELTLAPTDDADYVDEYPYRSTASILTDGDIWVRPGSSVTAGAAVFYNATTGVLDDSGGSGPVPGARWMTGLNAEGLATLRLSGLQRT